MKNKCNKAKEKITLDFNPSTQLKIPNKKP